MGRIIPGPVGLNCVRKLVEHDPISKPQSRIPPCFCLQVIAFGSSDFSQWWTMTWVIYLSQCCRCVTSHIWLSTVQFLLTLQWASPPLGENSQFCTFCRRERGLEEEENLWKIKVEGARGLDFKALVIEITHCWHKAKNYLELKLIKLWAQRTPFPSVWLSFFSLCFPQ